MEITANAIQLVNSGANVLFTETPVNGCCSIIHRDGSGLVTLRGLNNGQCRARFKAFFSGNIAIPEGGEIEPMSLALAINGEPVASSTMLISVTTENTYENISSAVFIEVPTGCCSQISVRNTSAVPVNVQNANLIIERVA